MSNGQRSQVALGLILAQNADLLVLADSFYQNPWPAAFDAGWTFCGEYDGDPARLGKSVRRSVNAEGKLVDTNNSTNDFTPNATPSLK